MSGMGVDKLKRAETCVSIVQSTATTIAILAAAVWFLLRGEGNDRANIAHSVTHRQLHEDWTWVGLSVRFENKGNQRIDLTRALIRIQQVLPLHDKLLRRMADGDPLIRAGETAVRWPKVVPAYDVELDNEIEPNEVDTSFKYDFLIPSNVRTVRLYSYFEQQEQPSVGWSAATLYDLEPEASP